VQGMAIIRITAQGADRTLFFGVVNCRQVAVPAKKNDDATNKSRVSIQELEVGTFYLSHSGCERAGRHHHITP